MSLSRPVIVLDISSTVRVESIAVVGNEDLSSYILYFPKSASLLMFQLRVTKEFPAVADKPVGAAGAIPSTAMVCAASRLVVGEKIIMAFPAVSFRAGELPVALREMVFTDSAAV